MASQANSRTARNASPLVVYHDPPGETIDWLRLLPAVVVCVIVHSILFALLFIIHSPVMGAPPTEEANSTNSESTVQSDPQKAPENSDPLTITEVDPAAILPIMDVQYNVNRIENVSVPGVVNPNEPVGIEGAPKDKPPVNLPLPPGFGGGTGGALE